MSGNKSEGASATLFWGLAHLLGVGRGVNNRKEEHSPVLGCPV